MSRIGMKPVEIPQGAEVQFASGVLKVKGPKGALELAVPQGIAIDVKDGVVDVKREKEELSVRALHGTIRSLLANMLEGVTKGYTRELEIQGVGYRAQLQGRKLALNLGFSHVIDYVVPDGVDVEVKDNVMVTLTSCDKQLVGQVAALIRGFSPAEPYKGKGVRYKGEQVRRKAGKAVA